MKLPISPKSYRKSYDETPCISALKLSLKEVISEVIRKEVRNPHVNALITVTRVDITNDLHYAKVYISIIGTDQEKQETMDALQSASGFIAVNASKLVTMRYFPELTFKLDDSADKQVRIEMLLRDINQERTNRAKEDSDTSEP